MNFVQLLLAFLIASAYARSFLRVSPDAQLGEGERMSAEQLRTSLLEEIENSLGSIHNRGRIARIEAALYPTFASLPKNEFGNIGHATVRYALHRLFVQRHGWFVKGLEPAGDHWNSSSPAGVLKERVSTYVQELFEERLGGHGFGLHETAVLAATIEHLIHDEAQDRLTKAYSGSKISQTDDLEERRSETVLDAYLKRYLVPEAFADSITETELREIYPGWTETSAFAREVRRDFIHSKRLGKKLSFENMTGVVEEVGERFGRFQDSECRAMKTRLVALGDQGIGRVKLADFYRAALHDNSFEFQESAEYLRQLGALDETNPSAPSVIVANYINSQTNCIASSNLYSVCCLDECETLLGHVERELAKPEATPAVISSIIETLPSSTVQAPRVLSPLLRSRLDEVAAAHGGTVQLHGRLFAQWLHHAYPRECPFPHLSGSTNPRSPDEWMEEKGAEPVASEQEMRMHVTLDNCDETTEPIELSHWHAEEELLMPRRSGRAGGFWSFFRMVAFLTACVCFALTKTSLLSEHALAAAEAMGLSNLKKYEKSSHLPFDHRESGLRARARPGASYLA